MKTRSNKTSASKSLRQKRGVRRKASTSPGKGAKAHHAPRRPPSKQAPAIPRAENWVKGALFTRPELRSVSTITVGARHRKELGDVTALAKDINERGLLHPIVIDRHGKLIAGERRLKAWQLSKFRHQPIPVHVVPLEDIVAGEWAENDPQLRKDFTPSEAVAIKRAIEARLKPAAKVRQAEHGKTTRGRKAEKKAERDEASKSGAKAAAFTGRSRRTVEKAEAIVDAAAAEPEKYGKLKKDMDKSGRVDGPFKRLQVMKQADEIRKEPPPLPGSGPYRGVVIDFPWAAEPDEDDPQRLARGYYPYPTMSQQQIVDYAREKIAPILHADCVVALWITNYHLVKGHQVPVFEALGVDGVTIRTWNKDRMGRGQVLRGQTEHVCIATRGKPVIQVDNLTTSFHAAFDKKQHSLKPQKFYSDFERLVPAPRYATLFETVDRGAKWDGHGNKAPAKVLEAAE
jgi:N6-adenosine-specific RNA methylase IME4/ParB-like chromosome segregation protein Spo0J